ncbi:MAG: 3-deoxy-D-manno-octulosonic acid transferase [Kiritimatiellaeota bacterium]|nr:3-deoxy-D-manno-octulosonic acid transferase [Kiritimatiellota bacterium]
MKLLLYNLLFPFAFLAYLPVSAWKMFRRGGYARHFWERFALYSREQRARIAALGSSPIWVHAVSVGEVVAALSFIRRWQERTPDLVFVLSTTTSTGYATAVKKAPPKVVVLYAPLDCFFAVRRAFRAIRPRMLVIFEVEFWPNLITAAARRGVPTVLANGRLSDRSARGYARHKWFFGDLFRHFALFCVQTDEDAARLGRVVGDAVPVHVCNTMKFDQVPDIEGENRTDLLDEVFGRGLRIVWTAGSTHAGEEEWVVRAFTELKSEFAALKLVLVPRHHERTNEVRKVLDAAGASYRLLVPPSNESPAPREPAVDVLVVNTTGELMHFYAASDLVFVGKSLAGNHGGHNIIEPAIFGKPILHGPNMENFRAVAAIFRDNAAAIEVPDSFDGFRDVLNRLLRNPQQRQELGRKAREVVEKHRGAIDRTIDILAPLLRKPVPRVPSRET